MYFQLHFIPFYLPRSPAYVNIAVSEERTVAMDGVHRYYSTGPSLPLAISQESTPKTVAISARKAQNAA